MTFPVEYHVSVRRSIPASVALFSLLALPVIFVSSAHAQTNGVPASVTSPGFGGRPVNGTAPSVTSIKPGGSLPSSTGRFYTPIYTPIPNQDDGHHSHRHHSIKIVTPAVAYALPFPYAIDARDPDPDLRETDADYQGGPTIFDRRGTGEDSYIPPVEDVPAPHSSQRAEADSRSPEPPQAPTLLIFKDGHKVEVGNYAIVGDILIDLTPGHTRKVAVADLDLDATRKQNDDRGVTFQLPPPSQAN